MYILFAYLRLKLCNFISTNVSTLPHNTKLINTH